jgi:hypothetical protein
MSLRRRMPNGSFPLFAKLVDGMHLRGSVSCLKIRFQAHAPIPPVSLSQDRGARSEAYGLSQSSHLTALHGRISERLRCRRARRSPGPGGEAVTPRPQRNAIDSSRLGLTTIPTIARSPWRPFLHSFVLPREGRRSDWSGGSVRDGDGVAQPLRGHHFGNHQGHQVVVVGLLE